MTNAARRFNSSITVVTDVADEETVTIQMYGQLQPKRDEAQKARRTRNHINPKPGQANP